MLDNKTNNTERKSSVTIFIMMAVMVVVAFILGIAVTSQLKPNKPKSPGITSIGGDFSLQSSRGTVSLHDFNGKVVALYFGYASCPDVCPTSLGIMSSAIRSLGAAQQKEVVPVFVSVDPDRDTPEKLASYVKAFHPNMVGLTGSREQVDEVTGRYRMLYKIVPMKDSALGYTVDHASRIYIIGKNGILQSLAQHGSTPAEVAEKLEAALDR